MFGYMFGLMFDLLSFGYLDLSYILKMFDYMFGYDVSYILEMFDCMFNLPFFGFVAFLYIIVAVVTAYVN